jgi:hypothetical protein
VTTGRLDDFRRARDQLDEGVGQIGNLEVVNEGSVPDLARRILQTLGWGTD